MGNRNFKKVKIIPHKRRKSFMGNRNFKKVKIIPHKRRKSFMGHLKKYFCNKVYEQLSKK
jgi:hypothetical protein